MTDEGPGLFGSARAAGDVWSTGIAGAIGRVFKWVLTLGLVGVVGATWLGSWRYSDTILHEVLTVDPSAGRALLDDGEIVEVTDAAISLRPADDSPSVHRDGRFALRFPGGVGVVGPVLSQGNVVAREWQPIEGQPEPGMQFALDRDTYLRNPLVDHGIRYLDVQIPSPGEGQLPAWYIPGGRETWVIVTHDLGSGLSEALRTVPVYSGRGFPVLVISYRNDPGTFVEEDARLGHGLTEWRDLQAAVQWARETGARNFVLAGTGMGGSITLEFMNSSPFAEEVVGLILDSPALDLGESVDADPGRTAIPDFLQVIGKTIASFRFGVNWSELDYVGKFEAVEVPTLLLHGVEDALVPVELSDELAARYAGSVEYVRVDGAGHGEGWNVDPAAYESAVQSFLTDIIAAGLDEDEALATEPTEGDDGEA